MINRPLNHCLRCNYTWYPRGRDVSRRCPNCGAIFAFAAPSPPASSPPSSPARPPAASVGRAPISPVTIMFGIGCLVLFAAVVFVVAVSVSRDREPDSRAEVVQPDPGPGPGSEKLKKNKFRRGERVRLKIMESSARAIPAAADPRSLADAMRLGMSKDHPELKPLYHEGRLIDLPPGTEAVVTDTGPFWVAIRVDTSADRGRELFIPCEWADPIAGGGAPEPPPAPHESKTPQPSKMPEPEPKTGPSAPPAQPPPGVAISVAPPPRPVSTFPPPPGVWSSEWQQLGDVQVRVRAARIARAPLVDAAGRRSDSPSTLFLVWLDLQNLSPSRPREYRRWQPVTSGECVLSYPGGTPLGAPRIPDGRKLEYFGEYRQPLPAGGAPVNELLVFPEPAPGTESLTLTLDARRVDESDRFEFRIPAAAWK
ncbi:MAG: hypothetical protein JWO38_2943 [Gemmataceae bacterium]|nr:hypothetical protein [Gemmataceae bacterium]